MTDRRRKEKERMLQAEQFIDALRSEEVDAVVGKEHVLLLRLKEAEDALHRTEARYRGIVETQTEMICRRSPDGTIAFVNEAYCRFFGKSRTDLLGRTFDPPVHPDDRTAVAGAFEALRPDHPKVEAECRIMAEGALHWTRWTLQAFFDKTGRLEEIQAIGRDVTKRKMAVEELKITRDQLQAVLDHSRDGIHQLDLKSGRYVFMNSAQEKLTGFSLDELTGMTMEQAASRLHPDDRFQVEAQLSRIISGEHSGDPMQYRWKTGSGEYRWFSDSRKRILDDRGEVVSLIGISRDITREKRAEQALQSAHSELAETNRKLEAAYREVYEYSEAITHDINGVLRAVSNYVDFLYEDLSERLTGDQRLYLENLKRVSRAGGVLTKELRDLAKVGKYAEAPETIDFSGLLNDLTALYGAASQVEFVTAETWPGVTAQPSLVRLILGNLISNAVKFTPPDKGRIEVGWQESAPGRIELFVRDNGIGIDPRHQERIFRIFKRLHPAGAYEGSGIGLAIVKKAARYLGGAVRVESVPGEGSAFFVDLPR